jgi:hypothetical protein
MTPETVIAQFFDHIPDRQFSLIADVSNHRATRGSEQTTSRSREMPVSGFKPNVFEMTPVKGPVCKVFEGNWQTNVPDLTTIQKGHVFNAQKARINCKSDT